MTDYERAAEFGEMIGQFFGVLALLVAATVVYAVYRVRRQRSLIREEKVDPPWELPSNSETAAEDVSSDLDEWDRKLLADEISEAEWEANRRSTDEGS